MNTVEPLNKGHLRTEGIVLYSEVVPYWEVSHKKLNIDVKSPCMYKGKKHLVRSALSAIEYVFTIRSVR